MPCIAIRVDSSISIGAGHIVRCLTLAQALHKCSAEVTFICRRQPGDGIDWVRAAGFPVIELPLSTVALAPSDIMPDDAADTLQALRSIPSLDWLIVDHYGIDMRWERLMRSSASRILVIDDLANRPHDCDSLLDQNFYLNAEHRYSNLLPSHCKTFLGPRYMLLRDEFYKLKRNLRRRDGRIRNLMCFYGASDPTGETFKVLSAIQELGFDLLHVDVIVGNANPFSDQIAAICNSLPMTTFHCQTNKMAELCANADIALGAGGCANWERSFLGLPSLVTITADNQKETTNAVASAGGIWLLGEAESVNVAVIAAALRKANDAPEELVRLSEAALSIIGIGGNNAAQAVAKFMLT